MSRRDESDLLFWFGVLYVLGRVEDLFSTNVAPALENAGAKAYEVLHPSERRHMDDLPGHQWTKQALMALAARHNFVDPRTAAAIALAESGGVPGALGDGRTSVGLWQIHLPSWPQFSHLDMLNPEKNADAASRISKRGTDWHHWSTYRSGAYKRWL